MPAGRRCAESTPPEWWSLSLYDFLTEEFPLEGWIWEFMRRARLKEVLCNSLVDAMNPNPDLEELGADFWNYYKRYEEFLRQGKQPVFFPPSVIAPRGWPKGFQGQQYRINDEDLGRMQELRVDLTRPDSVILRDFKNILLELRESFPEPRRISPRIKEWVQNRTLQIWDLRQFKVPWKELPDRAFDEVNI